MALEQLTPHCWLFPGDNARTRPWVGAIVTPGATLLVDAGNGPAHAREIAAALAAIGAPPVGGLLVTHHHWDHHFGACAFPDAPVVAHREAQRHLAVMAAEPWSEAYLTVLSERNPSYAPIARRILAAVPDFSTFRSRPADETFSDEWRREMDGVTVRFVHVGGPHEPDSAVVHVLPDNVLFVADAPYGRGARTAWDEAAMLAMYRHLADFGAAWIIEGHRPPQRPADLARRIAKLAARISEEAAAPDS